MDKKERIVFFDGHCPMCHGWVRRIIAWDKKKRLSFAPLESDAGRRYLSRLMPDYLQEDTIIYYEAGKLFLKSDAVLRIARALGFPFSGLHLFRLFLPKRILDRWYEKVAGTRYKYGERYGECPLPEREVRDRFIR